MKHWIPSITVFLIALFCVDGSAQDINYKPVEIIGSNVIEINANLGDMIEAVFLVKNNSLDDFYIKEIKTDCQCTAPVFPTMIRRGTTDSITVVFNTSNTPPGAYLKKAYLETPDDKVIELILQGNIVLVRNKIKAGEKPDIYKPVHIRLRNDLSKLSNAVWSKTYHDFGYVPAPKPAITKFILSNLGPSNIEFKLVEPGCSCTISDFTKGVIKPGDAGIVTASFTTKGTFGYFKKFIKVELTDGRIYNLAITGNVEPE